MGHIEDNDVNYVPVPRLCPKMNGFVSMSEAAIQIECAMSIRENNVFECLQSTYGQDMMTFQLKGLIAHNTMNIVFSLIPFDSTEFLMQFSTNT